MADLGGAHGHSLPGRIAILESLTAADTAAVLVHEFAHLLYGRRLCSVRPFRGRFGGAKVNSGEIAVRQRETIPQSCASSDGRWRWLGHANRT